MIRPKRRISVIVVRWTDELCSGYKRVSRFETPCIRTRWTGERWAEQVFKLHGTTCSASDSVAPLRRRSPGWLSVRMNRLSAGVERRHPVTIRKEPLMAGLMRWVWELRHPAGGQYSAVDWTRVKVAVRNVVATAPQPEPARRLKFATRNVNFLLSDSRCKRYVSDQFKVAPRYLGSAQKEVLVSNFLN